MGLFDPFKRKLIALALGAALVSSSRSILADDVKAIPVAQIERSSPVDFEKEVLPILSTSCLACHNKTKAKAKLDLETPATIRKGGESGPAAIPGKGLESLLVKAAAHAADVDSPMPPPKNTANAADLTSAQLGLIRLWIDQGATGEVHNSAATLKWVKLAPVVQPIYAVATSPDGQIAVCGRGNRIDVYNLPTGRLIARLVDPKLADFAHRDLVESLAFSPNGMTLASGSYREIKLWRRPVPMKKYELADAVSDAQCVAVSRDQKRFAVGDAEGKIHLFNASDGKPIAELSGHDKKVTGLSFSPDGRRLVSVSIDETLRVWDVDEPKCFCKVEAPCELHAVAWIEKGKRIAAGGDDGVIRLWDVPESADSEMNLSAELKGHEGAVNSLAGFASGKQILSGGVDGTVRIWDVASGHQLRQANHGAPVIAVATRDDGKRFASAGLDNTVKLWNGGDAKLIAESKGDPALRAASIRSERALTLAGGEIDYCKARIAEAEKEMKAQSDRVQAARTALVEVVKNIDAKQLTVDAAKAQVARVVDEIAARKRSADAVALAEEVLKSLQDSVAADKSGDADKAQLAAAADALKKSRETLAALKFEERKKAAEAAVVAANGELAKVAATKTLADQEVTSAGQTSDAASKVLARANDVLKFAQTVHGEHERAVATAKKSYADSAKPIRSIAFSPDGTLLAAADDDGLVRTLYSEKGTPGDLVGDRGGSARSVAFVGNDTLIAVGKEKCTAWDFSSPWTLRQTLGSADGASPIADRVTSLDFSPDGQLIASGGGIPSRGGEVKLWDSADGKLLKSFDEVHVDTVNCVRFSPDGQRLACASADRFVRVIDPANGKILLTLEGHQHHVLGVAWQRDGHMIASAGADNTLRFWNADTGERRSIVTTFDKEVTSVSFVADTNQALVTTGDGRVTSFTPDGAEMRPYPGSTGFAYSASITPDGNLVIAGGEDEILRAWEFETGRLILSAKPLK